MILTIEQLKKIIPTTPEKRIALFIDHLNKYMPQFGIDTKNEVASFLSQILHESGRLKYTREIWGPTPAQTRYEGRKDLGNTKAGDGKKFMGRGLIQVTGRINYRTLSVLMFGDNRLLERPELLEEPEYAVFSACIYWKSRGLDKFDDDDSIDKESRLVNGGTNGLSDRQGLFKICMEVL